jgi:ABC-type nitrate/sulfonate/bicarbonate transport system ATPase subunit
VHSIVGPSGCGKSTLLRLIGGLERPDQGTITLRGTPSATNRVALVFQDPTLLPWWSVGRNVAIGAEFDRRRRPLYERIRNFNLDRVGLRHLAHRRPNTLSLGQQTRASIGRALAHDADVTLLDEPFVHLDAMAKRRIWDEFETHWQLQPRTYVLVTHDIEEAVLLSDRITVLSGSNPTSVVETIDVGLARPRRSGSITEPSFRAALAQVWEAVDPHSGGDHLGKTGDE